MSVKVDPDRLAEVLGDFPFAYLVTVGDDYRAHTVAVAPVATDGILRIDSIGNSTRRNASAHPAVTLVWPPREPGGYSLIVDGRAEAAGDGMRIRPAGAVLHRPATPGVPTASGCGDDCVPLRE
ncbi:pyridoxamine 5'-phosphate oxidase family protein [Mycobacterium sp. 4D054]|uniref:pyridoxamine 5'-phosphate oxidase family protein n=1 Tax=unclassified Mycobacterium TaxID=2642494 RepID=UPI0021B2E479|nr:pyridoxamine 5'-phosphate oxidase family protein [Mycobacterium sp. SMC-8]UXA14238.1 pyridoxamine 5'-phosphate oxidase family protein [Mycobacterium sp. SMC-8]